MLFGFTTEDAAGYNMITTVTWEILKWTVAMATEELGPSVIHVNNSWVEIGVAGDKKATALNLTLGRGIHAMAQVEIPEQILRQVLKVDSDMLLRFSDLFHRGVEKAGGLGHHINIANALTGIFIATGQDVASISESMPAQLLIKPGKDFNKSGGIDVSLNLPTLGIGTIGGGTSLPTQRACLEMMDCYGKGKVKRFAEILAGFCLSLDISTVASLACGQFAQAHERLGKNHPDNGLKADFLFSDQFFRDICKNKDLILHSWEEKKLDSGASILADIAKADRSMRKLIGHFGFTINILNSDTADVGQLGVVVKSKATNEETVSVINKMAQGCGGKLSRTYEQFEKRSGFTNACQKEMRISSLAATVASLQKVMPHIYHTYSNKDNDIYYFVMEYLDNTNVSHLNTIDNVSLWTAEDINAALTGISAVHADYLDNKDKLDHHFGNLLEHRYTAKNAAALSQLWRELLEYNVQEFPQMWEGDRNATAARIIDNLPHVWQTLGHGPTTLVHNDFNPRNICLRLKTPAVPMKSLCVYDWELATIHVPQHDIAEFLLFTLTPPIIQESVIPYIREYQSALISQISHDQSATFNNVAQCRMIDDNDFLSLFDYCVMDIVINRLGLYTMAHTFKDYTYLPRVLDNAFGYLDSVKSKYSFLK